MSYEIPPPPGPLRQLARSAGMVAIGMAIGWFIFVGVPRWWQVVGKPLMCVAAVAVLTACGGGDPEDDKANTQPVNCGVQGACK